MVAKAVEQYSNESMKKALDATEDGAILSGDGRYPIRRNSSHCTFDIINTQSNKVIALRVADKKSINHSNETFTSTSNMLETEAMNRALQKIRPIKEKVSRFIIDGDNKNRRLLEDKNYQVIRDPNHLVLSFNKYLDKELMKYKKMIQGIPDCFRNLRTKIKKWYSNLVFMNLNTDIKKQPG